MASGGIRFDFTEADRITPGEYREIETTITDVDGNAANASAWTVAWYLVNWLSDANGIAELDAATLLKKTPTPVGSVATIVLEPPDLPRKARKYFYEFWRTDAGQVRRLSYGDFPIIA